MTRTTITKTTQISCNLYVFVRCVKFDLSFDSHRGSRIFANRLSVRCEAISQCWRGIIKLQYINPKEQLNSLCMVGNNATAEVFMLLILSVIDDRGIGLLEMLTGLTPNESPRYTNNTPRKCASFL